MSPISPESLREDILEIKEQLNRIQKSVDRVAVQDERIRHVELSQEAVWKKFDKMQNDVESLVKHDASCPRDTVFRMVDQIDAISRYQASCPREQVKWVWWVLVPQGLVLLGILVTVIALILHGDHP